MPTRGPGILEEHLRLCRQAERPELIGSPRSTASAWVKASSVRPAPAVPPGGCAAPSAPGHGHGGFDGLITTMTVATSIGSARLRTALRWVTAPALPRPPDRWDVHSPATRRGSAGRCACRSNHARHPSSGSAADQSGQVRGERPLEGIRLMGGRPRVAPFAGMLLLEPVPTSSVMSGSIEPVYPATKRRVWT